MAYIQTALIETKLFVLSSLQSESDFFFAPSPVIVFEFNFGA